MEVQQHGPDVLAFAHKPNRKEKEMNEPIEVFEWERPPQDIELKIGFLLRRYNQYLDLLRERIMELENHLTYSEGQITMHSGNAAITLKKDGTINIKGKDIEIDASGRIMIKASSTVDIKGSKIVQN